MNSVRRLLLFFVTPLALLGCASGAMAHDSWLIADKNAANKDDEIWLSFVTGEEFPLGEKATAPSRVASFVDVLGKITTDISGYLPQDKGLSVRKKIEGGGLHVIGIALRANSIEMTPEKFESYLREERADAAIERFSKKSDKPAKVVEEYTKFAKTMVNVDPTEDNDTAFKKPIGHRLEIIPQSNPCQWKVGDTVKIEVLLDGFRWANVPVSLGFEGSGEHTYAAQTRTNDKGMASFTLSKPGHAFIKAHFIRPLTGLGKATWESYWASLTFRVLGDSKVNEELRSIRGIHGDLTPGAVLGFRAGQTALRELGLGRGADRLMVRHKCPASVSFASVVDGIQAATGATLGRLNMELSEVQRVDDIETTFVNRTTGKTLSVQFPAEVISEIQSATDPFTVESLSLRLATMPDESLFTLSPTDNSAQPILDPSSSALSRR